VVEEGLLEARHETPRPTHTPAPVVGVPKARYRVSWRSQSDLLDHRRHPPGPDGRGGPPRGPSPRPRWSRRASWRPVTRPATHTPAPVVGVPEARPRSR